MRRGRIWAGLHFAGKGARLQWGLPVLLIGAFLIRWTVAGSGTTPGQLSAGAVVSMDDELARLSVSSAVRKQLQSADPFERIHAANVLSRSFPNSIVSIRVLSAVLSSDNAEARALAAFFLGIRGTIAVAALPELSRLLQDDVPLVRLQAGEAVLRIAPGTEEAIDALLQGLRDSSPEVRLTSVFALAGADASRSVRVFEAISKASGDADPQVAHAAAIVADRLSRAGGAALTVQGELTAFDTDTPPTEMLDSPSPELRADAARRLGLDGPNAVDSLPALQAKLIDPVAFVRAHAARAIWLITGEVDPGLQVLKDIVSADQPETSTAVIQTLGEMGVAASELHSEMIRYAVEGDEFRQLHVAIAACRMEPRDTRGWDILSAGRRNVESRYRLLSVLALSVVAPLRPDFVENEIRDSIGDANLRVRLAAAESLEIIRTPRSVDPPNDRLFVAPPLRIPQRSGPENGFRERTEMPVSTEVVLLRDIEPDDSSAVPIITSRDDVREEEVIDILPPERPLHVPTTADLIPPLVNRPELQAGDRLASRIENDRPTEGEPAVANLPETPANVVTQQPSPVHESESVGSLALSLDDTPLPDPPQQRPPPESEIRRSEPAIAGDRGPMEDAFAMLDRPIQRVRADVETLPGELPPNHSAARLAETPAVRHGLGISRNWYGSVFGWAPTALNRNPIYLEDLNAERYGYNFGVLQGVASGVQFFGTIPTLPYRVAANPPWQQIYTLGLDRPGNCVPFRYHRLPWHTGAAIVQAGTIAGVIFLIP